jgi:hypothetical protein
MPEIYHLTTAADWEVGLEAGAYSTSTRGKTLEEVMLVLVAPVGR